MNQDGYHLSPEEFRRRGYALVDWIAAYWQRVETLPVLSPLAPGEVGARLPAQPPLQGEPFEQVMRDLEATIVPGLTHWQSPNFFAYFPANSSGPSVLGDLLSSGLGIQGMLWATSPACTELEMRVLDWLAGMLGLPEKFCSTGSGGGVIQDSASSAVLAALVAARERATAGVANERGLREAAALVAYTSDQAHSSVEKAMRVAGLGSAALRKIPVDAQFAMRADLLAEAIAADSAAGLRPFLVCATVGTTSSLALDPIADIALLCRRYKLWLHVDAAMAGSAAICPEYRWIQDGAQEADSYCFDPHKWLFTNFDCSCLFVARREELVRALTILPEYLRNQATASGAVWDYRDWHVPLGRRFRALKLWLVIRHYGVEGLRFHLRKHIALAQEFAHWVEQDERFELAAPVALNLVCFRWRHASAAAADHRNERLLEALNRGGKLYLSHTKLNGRFTLRFCVGQTHTEARHVEAAWAEIQRVAETAPARPEAGAAK